MQRSFKNLPQVLFRPIPLMFLIFQFWVFPTYCNAELMADGPGSSSVGIENALSKCALHWSQHGWVYEKTGKIEQSSDIKIIVQCSSK
jgi:hypothetical protein